MATRKDAILANFIYDIIVENLGELPREVSKDGNIEIEQCQNIVWVGDYKLTITKGQLSIMGKIKLNIWMSLYRDGEAIVYVEDDEGVKSKCNVIECENYSVKELQKMLSLDRRYKALNAIAREIYSHNQEVYERNKCIYARYWGWSKAEKDYGSYPTFERRLKVK